MIYTRTQTRGFTLIEALVAVTIVTLAIAGPMYTASRAIVAAQIAQDQITASYLAQEGVEYVRAMRDDAFLSSVQGGGDPWKDFLVGTNPWSMTQCIFPGTCTLDPSQPIGNTLRACNLSGGTCSPLYLVFNGTSNIYIPRSDVGGTKTSYVRTVQIVNLLPTDAGGLATQDVRVVSKVTWSTHGKSYSAIVTDHLTPWQ